MNQEIYKNYADNVKSLLANEQRRGALSKGNHSTFTGNISKESVKLMNESKDISLFNSLQPLSRISGHKLKYHEKPGLHPDFSGIKTSDESENHYITSMFIDIKNSTGLFRNYTPTSVSNITTAIQKVAMHTCWYFNGYIQRFHGDGLLVYFGGKNRTISESVNDAINAASFFSYFMRVDLKEAFQEQDIDRIFTRIGIDTGYEEDVVWHLAGKGECSEVTTCSLHTSLAAKMQNNADSNGIMLGDNVKNNLTLDNELFSIKKDNYGEEDRYIFQIPKESFYYTQWKFNWENYLKKHPLLQSDSEGKFYFKDEQSNPSLNNEFLKQNVQGYRPYFKR